VSEWTFDETDSGREVAVTIGEFIAIDVPDNASTGYAWVAATPADDVLTLTESRFRPPRIGASPGTAGRRRFVYLVHSAGSTQVALVRRPPWEPDSEPTAEFCLFVHAS
jgi:predicted secreted protein